MREIEFQRLLRDIVLVKKDRHESVSLNGNGSSAGQQVEVRAMGASGLVVPVNTGYTVVLIGTAVKCGPKCKIVTPGARVYMPPEEVRMPIEVLHDGPDEYRFYSELDLVCVFELVDSIA